MSQVQIGQMLTEQEAFSIVWKAFVVEKRPPSIYMDTKQCLYRGKDGQECAAGLIMPNARYDSEWDTGLGDLQYIIPRVPEWKGIRSNLLQAMQSAHDRSATGMPAPGDFHEGIEDSLRYVARTYGLTIPSAE